MFPLHGNTAIVTGAGSGICFSFASQLLSGGCNVVIADLALRPEAQELVEKHRTGTPKAIFVQSDVTSWNDLTRVFETTLNEFGDFGIVCPGAGVYEPHWSNFWHPPGSKESKDPIDSDHYKLFDINLTHPIRVTQLALSHWLFPRRSSVTKASAQTPKRVVHISSVAGQSPNFVAPLYAASKFAISGFVRSLAELEQSHGVRVTAVAPGIVRTPLWTEHPEKLINIDPEQDGWVTPDEVAKAMLSCVEDDSIAGGSIVEVGKDNTRLVNVLNDPGPDPDPKKGLVSRNKSTAVAVIMELLSDGQVWGEAKPTS
ncbi:short-chain dehydrogenase [Whalleya microplaca]|nr:short-chain dehydrogenase [Whalleya microplaca]